MIGLTMEDRLFCELGDFLASAVVTRCQEEPVFCLIVPGLQEEIPPIIKHVGLNGKIIYRWGNFVAMLSTVETVVSQEN